MKGGSCECDIHGKRENYDRGEGGEIEYHKKEKSYIKGWEKMRQWGRAGERERVRTDPNPANIGLN